MPVPPMKFNNSLDFSHNKSNGILWLNNLCKPAWVDAQLAVLDMQVQRPEPTSTLSLSNDGGSRWVAGYATPKIVGRLCGKGQLIDAVNALGILVQAESGVSVSLFYSVLKRCGAEKNLVLGRRVHDLSVEVGYESNTFLGNHILRMYASHGRLQEAMDVFRRVANPNAFMWSSILYAQVKHGQAKQAIQLYQEMRNSSVKPDCHVFVAALQACASAADLQSGRQVHVDMLKSGVEPDMFVYSCLLDMYAKCDRLEDARTIFDSLTTRNMVTCSAMIAGYTKCGRLEEARRIFDSLVTKNVVTWTAMIAGYAQQGRGKEALSLYSSMQREGINPPDAVTYVCLLQACASVGVEALRQGKQFHAQIEERGLEYDVGVGNSLVNMYAKCGSLEGAQRVFDRLPHRDVVTWNAIIAGYAQQGMGREALGLYTSMQEEGRIAPDAVTFVCLLQACAGVAALHQGQQILAQIEERGLRADVVVGTSVVNMYAKCGNMVDAQQAFDSLRQRDIVAWSALIAGYTFQGDSEKVFDLVQRMREDGIQPNDITFLSVLTVCSHVGLVRKGREYFESMSTDYGITPNIDHYTCMVDLLGRAGQLDKALAMVKAMPFQPNSAVCLTLLGACRKWGNIEVGIQAFELAVQLDGKDAAVYVLMANIYAGAQMWKQAKEMQARRMNCGAWKQPGQSSWTDMSGVVHTFVVGDKKHPESEGIYARLEQLVPRMKKEGYVPHLQSSLRDMSDEEKEAHLCGHSERLAIAFALNKTPEGTTIRIVKNLRVCADCHIATAYISMIEKRTIICRDASRFHVYKEGKCSCGDYW